jgi:hypothetical protein
MNTQSISKPYLWLKSTWLIFACSLVTNCYPTTALTEEVPEALNEAQVCPLGDCRRNLTITLRKPDGSKFEQKFDLIPPIVQGDMVTIFPGDNLFVEANFEGRKLKSLKSVSDIATPERTIEFNFSQSEKIGDGTGMVLKVRNPFDRPLKFHVGKMILEDDRIMKTSSCPVVAKGMSFEHWPEPIFQLVVEDFRLIEPGTKEASACVY